MTISTLVAGVPHRLPLIGVIMKKTKVIYMLDNKYKRFEWTLNDGTGEVIVPFWNSLKMFDEYYYSFNIGETISISHCAVDRVPPQYSKGHSLQLKLINSSKIVVATPIQDFRPYILYRNFTDLKLVTTVSDNIFIWVCGIVSEIGDQKANLMDDGTRCDIKIRDNHENILNVTVWGEHEICMFDKLEICGRNREFMSLLQFSCLSSDIIVNK
jgi:hypothetical protein